MRFLFRPGWIGLTAAVVLFAVAAFTLLGPWQFRRHDERAARNDAITRSFDQAPVPLESVPADAEWRQVTMTGRYLPDAEAVARLRTVLGEPAFEVLTPFRLDSGTVVLVDRGFVRPERGAARGVTVPAYDVAPGGDVTIVGRLRKGESDGQGRGVIDEGGRRQVYAVDPAVVGGAAGLTIRPSYVQLNAGQPGVLEPMPLPQLDAGPHLAYALQWLGFGAMALVGLVLLARRERMERSLAPSAARAHDGGEHR